MQALAMRLALRFTIAVVAAITLVLGLHAYWSGRAEITMLDADMNRDARVMGRLLSPLVADAWNEEGPDVARRMVSKTNEREPFQLRLIVLDEDEAVKAELSPKEIEAISRGVAVTTKKELDGEDFMVNYVPVRLPDGQAAALEFADSLAGEHAAVSRLLRGIGATTVVLVGMCGGLTIALGFWFVGRPIRGLVQHARRVGRGDFSSRIALAQSDELGELAKELDAMTVQLGIARRDVIQASNAKVVALEQLRHAERLATVGTLASGVAHELGTPLHVIMGHADLVDEAPDAPADTRASAQTIREQAKRMADIIRQLLDFARRRDDTAREEVDLVQLLERASRLTTTISERANITVTAEKPSRHYMIACDSAALTQVFTNIIVNGVQAMPMGGSLTLKLCEHVDSADNSRKLVRVDIEDRGSGMSKEILERVFEPFFTTKDVGMGTGLGLSVAHGIVEEHGGFIEVSSSLGAGSCFSVFLPLLTDLS